jgi:hypothetical protein
MRAEWIERIDWPLRAVFVILLFAGVVLAHNAQQGESQELLAEARNNSQQHLAIEQDNAKIQHEMNVGNSGAQMGGHPHPAPTPNHGLSNSATTIAQSQGPPVPAVATVTAAIRVKTRVESGPRAESHFSSVTAAGNFNYSTPFAPPATLYDTARRSRSSINGSNERDAIQ